MTTGTTTTATQETPVHVPISEVVVFEDRAQIVRRESVVLSAGWHRLVVAGVAPVIADSTVSAKFTGGPEVAEAVVRRRRRDHDERTGSTDDAVDTLREAEAEHAVLSARHHLIEQQRRFSEATTARTLEDVTLDAAWNLDPIDGWRQRVDADIEREHQLRESLLKIGGQIADLERRIDDLRRRVHHHDRPDRRVATDVVLTVRVDEDGSWPLELRYVVPAACWRPWHTARIDGPDLVFSSDGSVWQNTGEDWAGVRLALSTQRPSLGTEPPYLSDDIITAQAKPESTTVMVREQEIQTTGLGSEVAVARELPGIDDGGEVRVLEVSGRQTVRSDGQAHRVPLGEFRTATELDLETLPERATAVVNRAVQLNLSTRPVLAGPVDLLREGALVGRSSTGFVAPGERFAIGFGPEPTLTVRRRVDEVDEPAKALSRKARTTTTVTLFLSNIGTDPRTFSVTERIPVSEIDEVKATLDEATTSDGATADANGLVHWTVTLPGDGRRTLRLAYTVSRHRDVDGI